MRTVYMVVVVALAWLSLGASHPQVPQAKTEADRRYLRLLAAARTLTPGTDFLALRLAYSKTSFYDPITFRTKKDLRLYKLFKMGEYDQVLRLGKQMLQPYYLNINLHYMLAVAAHHAGDKGAARRHRFFYNGLLKSILKGKDGRTPDNAFVVIDPREEHAVLRVADLEYVDQKLKKIKGRKYDVFAVRKGIGETPFSLYFDVEIPFQWARKHLN